MWLRLGNYDAPTATRSITSSSCRRCHMAPRRHAARSGHPPRARKREARRMPPTFSTHDVTWPRAGAPLGRAIHRARKREASTACRRLSQLTPSHRRCHVAPRRHAAGGRAIHHKASAPPCRHAFQVNSVIHSLSTETLLNKALIAGRRQCSSSSLSLCSTLATHLMAALTTKALRTVDFTRRPL